MSRIPQVIIGGRPFAELYPQWELVLLRLQQLLEEEMALDPVTQQPRTPRAYMADPKRFLHFFTAMIRSNPDLGIQQNQIDDTYLYAHDEFFGLGMLRPWLDDPAVEDILMNDYTHIISTRGGVKSSHQSPFVSDLDAKQWMQRMMDNQGKQLHDNNPIESGQLSDGSRIICLIPPIVPTSGFAIRKHRSERFQQDAYLQSGVAPQAFFDDLQQWIMLRYNMLIAGATGSGKTTLVNYAGSLIPHDERILVVEDTRELIIPHPGVYQMTALVRESRDGAQGSEVVVPIRKLVKATLRMKPDRIIVGETRGPEAFDMLDAMNTGHDGGMTTLHANSPSEVILRLESLAAPANPNMPLSSLQDLIGSTIGIIIQMMQMPGSSRRVVVEAAQVFHPSQTLDPDALKPPTRAIRPDKVYIRPLWLWNAKTEQLERVGDPIDLHGQYFIR